MSNVARAVGDGKPICFFQTPPSKTFSCTVTCTVNYAERRHRLDQLRALEKMAPTLDERRSWEHASRKIERSLAACVAAPSPHALRAVTYARIARAGGRRAPRAPRRAIGGTPPPDPGDQDPDPDHRSATLATGVAHV